MKYLYEAVVEPVGDSYEATFPDFGIVTFGSDMQDVAFMAQDLLENHIVVMLQMGKGLPAATFNHGISDNGYRLGIVVDCDTETQADETMTVSEAADALDVTEARVRAMIRSGILSSRKVGRVHMVDAESVMRRFNEPAHAGRPRKAVAR